MLIFKFIAITVGISLAISLAKPLKRLREAITRKSLIIGEFINCTKCLAFWVSFPIYFYVYKVFTPDMIAYAFVAFLAGYILENIKSKCS